MKALGGACYTHAHMLFYILGKSCTTLSSLIGHKIFSKNTTFGGSCSFTLKKVLKRVWQKTRKLGILKEILQGEANLET